MTRMLYLAFFGERRWAEEAHPHEAPRVMTVPLAALALLALAGGVINTPWRLGLEHFLEPAFPGVPIAAAGSGFSQLVLAILSAEVAAAGIVLAVAAYRRGLRPAEEGPAWGLVRRGYGVDEAYARVVRRRRRRGGPPGGRAGGPEGHRRPGERGGGAGAGGGGAPPAVADRLRAQLRAGHPGGGGGPARLVPLAGGW